MDSTQRMMGAVCYLTSSERHFTCNSHEDGPQSSSSGGVHLSSLLLDVRRAFFCSLHWFESEISVPLRNVCGCHRYLLHRLGGLGPELAELAWSSPLCT